MEMKCNCNKEWSEKCKKRVTDWMEQNDELEMYPSRYWLYYEEYKAKGIISFSRNDENLYNYLKNNNILGEKVCYLKIAYKLILKDYIHNEKDNVDSILNYLYWSYGLPYDENNYLLRKFILNKQIEIREKYKISTEPREYFYFLGYRYKSKNRNKLALDTIGVLGLNDTNTTIKLRFVICNAIIDKLDDINELLYDYIKGTNISTRRKNRIVNGIKNVLQCAQPTEEYSAIISTTVINDDNYKHIKNELVNLKLWDSELDNLEKEAINIMFYIK